MDSYNIIPYCQLFRTLVDYIDDGKGNCEIYYRDCAVCSCKLRAVYPTETGTFEPYEEFVLSDEEEEEWCAVGNVNFSSMRMLMAMDIANWAIRSEDVAYYVKV